MKALWTFIRATLVGGLLVLVPLYVAALVVVKLVGALEQLLKPLARMTPLEPRHDTIFAIGVALLASLLIGLAIQTRPGQRLGEWIRNNVLTHIPGYDLVRSVTRRSIGDDSGEFEVALAEIEDGLTVVFVVERHADGRFTVFVPGSPTAFSGKAVVLEAEQLQIVDIPFVQAVRAMGQWGTGMRDIVAALEAQKGTGLAAPRAEPRIAP